MPRAVYHVNSSFPAASIAPGPVPARIIPVHVYSAGELSLFEVASAYTGTLRAEPPAHGAALKEIAVRRTGALQALLPEHSLPAAEQVFSYATAVAYKQNGWYWPSRRCQAV